MSAERKAPRATYRLQLTPEFGFADAAAQVPYLAALGVSHLYLSPITEAVPGSRHGYDVADPRRLRAELGGEEGFARLGRAAAEHGLGLVVDVVPNHMAADASVNPWWRDVLEDGEQSPYAGWFDIDWAPPDPELRGRVMIPLLADSLDATLDAGELALVRDPSGGIVVRVPGAELPVALPTAAPILGAAAVRCGSEVLAEIGTEAMLLPAAAGADERHARLGARETLRQRIAALAGEEPGAGRAIDEMLGSLTRDRRRLRALLDAQVWLLDGWRRGLPRLNYRRFFTVSSLAGVRSELVEVRRTGVQRVLELVAEGSVQGLRVDHVDGLRDPAAYLAWLHAAAGGAWTVVEKILAPEERLPAAWECDGTTGYEFGAVLVACSVSPHGVSLLEVLRDDLAGPRPEFSEMVRAAKLELLAGDLLAEWERVSRALAAVAARDPRLEPYPQALCEEGLRELLAALRVYRTYVAADGTASDDDRAALHAAAVRAQLAAGLPGSLLEALAAILGGERWDPEGRCALLVSAVQQLSPALAAKGVEDTAIYREASLLARDEVGCDPARPPAGPEAFHAAALAAQARGAIGLLATSTHDSKRSEDVRARLCVLSELAGGWAPTARDWAGRHRHLDPGGDAMLVVLQTLVGAWPIDADRVHAYLVKAMREAGERTSWTEPDAAYEARLRELVDGLCGDRAVVAEVEEVVNRVRPLGERVSLAWALLRLTAPGIPDTYQGCELWDLSLVDPDNRRPVDWTPRAALLEEARTAGAGELMARSAAGLPKLAVIHRALDLRRRRPELFGAGGDYRPLAVAGPLADHAIAYSRGAVPGAVTVAPRLPSAVEDGWGGTRLTLPEGRWRNLFTGGGHGGETCLDDLLGGFPVGLLEREEAGASPMSPQDR